MENKNNSTNKEFSKVLLIQESILLWIINIAFLGLAYICIIKDYTGSLPWLEAMVSFPWAAYAVSQVFYYKKSLAENTRDGIKFETIMAQALQSNRMPYMDSNVDSYVESDIEPYIEPGIDPYTDK